MCWRTFWKCDGQKMSSGVFLKYPRQGLRIQDIGMQGIAGGGCLCIGDHNSVQSRIIDDLSFVRCAILKIEFLGCVARVRAACGTYSNEVQPTDFVHCWQQRVHRETPRAQHSNANRLAGSRIDGLLSGNYFESWVLLRRLWIRDQHTQKRLTPSGCNDLVCV